MASYVIIVSMELRLVPAKWRGDKKIDEVSGDDIISYGVVGLPGYEQVEITHVGPPSAWKLSRNWNTRPERYDSPEAALNAFKAELASEAKQNR